ncbi:MAG: nitroreductase/quinone reductase family protein [Hyphomicrobiales bacterium]
MTTVNYQKPDWFTAHVMNPLIAGAARLGMSPRGAAVLAVRGRSTGEWRSTPVNPLTLSGQRYLVAPRGETHWVRNIRALGEARLRRGRTEETIRVAEVPDGEKLPILREYLRHWRAETGKFFKVSKDPSDDELTRVAPNHPVFRIVSSDEG